MISYLPLAHMAEWTQLCICYAFAVEIGFYSGDKNWTVQIAVKEDLKLLWPTHFVAVPRILEWLAEVI